jgi:hypothetical protein
MPAMTREQQRAYKREWAAKKRANEHSKIDRFFVPIQATEALVPDNTDIGLHRDRWRTKMVYLLVDIRDVHGLGL